MQKIRAKKSGILSLLIILLVSYPVYSIPADTGGAEAAGETKGGGKTPLGSIKGRVLDYETKKPLADAVITIDGTVLTTRSNRQGNFEFLKIPVGSYSLSCRRDGYYSDTKTDIGVRPRRTAFLDMELFKTRMLLEEVSVEAGAFPPNPSETGSTLEFNKEEIRRDAGTVGADINRALYNIPGVSQTEEIANDLIVRGGSPMENGFYVDNIPFINVNHFPQQGASGGNVSYLNMDFIENIKISTGGFDASFGNRLSSIIDISYREGNRERMQGQLNLGMTGAGAEIEGPLPNKKGAYMFSFKRSYLDLVKGNLGTDEDEMPTYYDFQGKVTYDLNANHHFSLLAIGGHSETMYGDSGDAYEKYGQWTTGVNWRWLWGDKGYSDTSISYARLKAWENRPESQSTYHNYVYYTEWISLRNVNRWQLSPTHQFQFGAEAKQVFFKYRSNREFTEEKYDGMFAGAFLTYTVYPFNNLSVNAGLRLDYYPFSQRVHISPRFSFSWMLTDRLSLNGAYGIFYQQMSLFLLKQHPGNETLKDPRARHLVLGLKYLLGKNTRVSLDVYDKRYQDIPMTPRYPYYYPLDNVSGDSANSSFFGPLVDVGKSYARGIELSIQKKLADKLYGLVSFTYFRTRYRDLMGKWHNRLFDNRYILCISGGYKPSKRWEFNGRFIWSGNRAFTPVDEERSIRAGFPWVPVENIMSGYLPDYQSLSLRVDRRWFFKKSSIVAYFGALNVFDRDNIIEKFWIPGLNQYETVSTWGFFPYLGLEFEF